MDERPYDLEPLLGMLLDVRVVFDPGSSLTATLENALGEDRHSAVAWVALPEPAGRGLVIEHVLGQRTEELSKLGVAAGRGLTGRVFQREAVHWVEQYSAADSITHEFDAIIEAERIRRMIAAPLRVNEELLGVLSVGRRDHGAFGDDTIARVEQLAQAASAALVIARAARDNAAASALAERRRLSEELHDGVGALLFSLSARTERLSGTLDLGELRGEVAAMGEELGQVGSLVRDLVGQWHDSATDDLQAEVRGVAEDFERRSTIETTTVFLGSLPPLDGARMQAITRFVGVALSNVERHASAQRATVTVSGLPGQVTVAISNDGPAPASIEPGVGLRGVEERFARLGGALDFPAEEVADGFTVRARIPVRRA